MLHHCLVNNKLSRFRQQCTRIFISTDVLGFFFYVFFIGFFLMKNDNVNKSRFSLHISATIWKQNFNMHSCIHSTYCSSLNNLVQCLCFTIRSNFMEVEYSCEQSLLLWLDLLKFVKDTISFCHKAYPENIDEPSNCP